MRVQIQLRIVTDDDTVLSEDVIACFDKGDDQLEEIGLSLDQANHAGRCTDEPGCGPGGEFSGAASRLPSVPMMMRHRPPGSLALRA